MNQSKKTLLITLVTAIFSSLFTYLIVAPMRNVDTSPMKNAIVMEQKQVETINQTYVHDLNKLKKENDSLLALVNTHKEEYEVSSQKVLQLQGKVNKLLSKVKNEADTSKQKMKEYDTLGNETSELIVQENQRDSLCNSEVNDLTTLVRNKDSALSDLTLLGKFFSRFNGQTTHL
jgi:hypothetical protein